MLLIITRAMNILSWISGFIQVSPKLCLRPKACNLIKKESLAQVFSCEFCEISKNTYFCRTPQVAIYIPNWIIEYIYTYSRTVNVNLMLICIELSELISYCKYA